jgi:hypothetical protein
MAGEKKRTTRTPKKRTAPDWAPKLLACLARTANIKAACDAAGVGRSTFYDRRDSDKAFAAAAAEALESAVDDLELEARRRAKDGVRRVKFHQGLPIMIQACGDDGRPLTDDQGRPVTVPYTEHEYSDTLMIFLLKAHRPEKYRERHEVSGPGGGPMRAESKVVHDVHGDLKPYFQVFREMLGADEEIPGDGTEQRVDPAPADAQAGPAPGS